MMRDQDFLTELQQSVIRRAQATSQVDTMAFVDEVAERLSDDPVFGDFVQTEYSGPYLGLIEIAHWLDLVLILGLCAMFWHTSVVGMAVLVGASLFTEILVDNITARLTWQWMVQKKSLLLGMGLALVNLLWLYVA